MSCICVVANMIEVWPAKLFSAYRRSNRMIFPKKNVGFFPFYGTETLLLWTCSGARGALPAPLPSPGRERGVPGVPLTSGAAPLAFASLQPHLLEAAELFYGKNLLIPSSKNHGRGSHPLRLPSRSLRIPSKPHPPLAWATPPLPFIHLV